MKKNSKKIVNPSTKQTYKEKRAAIIPTESKQPWWDIECRHSYQKKSINLEWVHGLADRLDRFTEDDPEALYVAQFYRKEGLTKDSYENLVSRHDFLKKTHKETMRELGDRIWAKCVQNKANLAAARLRLPRYAEENIDDEIKLARVKAEAEPGDGTIQVIMSPSPITKEVRAKVSKKGTKK